MQPVFSRSGAPPRGLDKHFVQHLVHRQSPGWALSLALAASAWCWLAPAAAQNPNRDITDQRIRFALEDMLKRDPGVGGHLVDIQVRDGIVSLDGYVETIRSRNRAMRLAESMRGVKAVENRIDVRAAERSDDELRQEVLAAIEDDPVLEAKDIGVEVQEGSARLTGEADSWAHKQLFDEAISGVRGLRNISNNLEVRRTSARDEREVAAEIRKRLARDVWTQDANVRVDVRNGVASLGGTVHSPDQRRRVEEAAFVGGIRSIDTSGLSVSVGPAGRVPDRTVRVTAMRDPQLAQEVNTAVQLDPRLTGANIEVQADGGSVTLLGEVPSYFAKQAAEQDAFRTVGVSQVENRLRVRPASALASDEDLAARIEQALNRDADTSRMNIQLDVRNGKVRLMGFVETAYERQLAEAVAARVDGVIDLENAVMLSGAGRALGDDELRGAIEEQLWWNPYVDLSAMTLNVREGAVTITGESPAYLNRELVSEIAVGAGAANVTNHLQLPRN